MLLRMCRIDRKTYYSAHRLSLVLPDYVNGKTRWSRLKPLIWLLRTNRSFISRNISAAYQLAMKLSSVCFSRAVLVWLRIKSESGYAPPCGKGVIAIYETDKMRDILEVYQYSYLDKLLKLTCSSPMIGLEKCIRGKKLLDRISTARSSNGKTSAFGADNQGSIPWRAIQQCG